MKRFNPYQFSRTLCLFRITVFLLFITGNLFAQSRTYRQYATQAVEARLLANNETLQRQKRDIEQFIHQQTIVGELPNVTIPVVFHIVHHEAEPSVTTTYVLEQIERLNGDFAGARSDFAHPEASQSNFDYFTAQGTNIQFCLAVDKAHPERSAIQYYPSETAEWSTDNSVKSAASGGVNPWDTDYFLNIWVTDLVDNISGYAQMPGGPTATDGIVIDKDFFINSTNTPYSLGRTLTNLAGSFIGLHQLWNESKRCADDYVSDTPIHNAPNFGPMDGRGHISTCHGRPIEMSTNFMDNTDDEFLNMFSLGQRLRMHKMLSKGGPRYPLRQGNFTCTPTPVQSALVQPMATTRDPATIPNGLKIYPNPATHQLFLERSTGRDFEGGVSENVNQPVVIFHASGKQMFQREWAADMPTLRVNIRDWPAGMYFVQTKHQGVRTTKKFSILK